MNYNVSVKIDGKWRTLGKVAINKFGHPALSFKNSQELKALVNSSAEWLNFSLFENKDDGKAKPRPAAPAKSPVEGDSIPW